MTAQEIIMKIHALTGGVATGKSTVARMFAELGMETLDADAIVHQLMTPRQTAWREIVKTFGRAILNSDDQIDRVRLGQIVFHDAVKRKQLEAILHPKVRLEMEQQEKEIESKGVKNLLLEIPLLFETGWDQEKKFDSIIVVAADRATQIKRAMAKTGLSKGEIEARIASQLPLSEKEAKADYTINNGADLNSTKKQVAETNQLLLHGQ